MKLHQLPPTILASVLAVQRVVPGARFEPLILGGCDITLPVKRGGVERARIETAEPDPASGDRGVWLHMRDLPFGKCRLTSAQAVADKIKAVIEGL
jgi:hypothetical protein